ncbi:MAG: cyclase family protein [Oscillospiraceae bacterium]|nr:cyclase family protein [Oscillospiraceae bacterium]
MCVYQLGGLRVVDLTKSLDPSTETRRCHLYRFNTGGAIPDYHTIMDLTSHLGTHCECPYHHDDNWPDVAALPLTNFMGRGIYVVLDNLLPNSHITAEALDHALGEKVRPGDVVILDSPYKLPPFTDKSNTAEDRRLFINGETARWMVEHKIKSVGFGDGVSIENCNEDVKPFHDICMAENITFLEVLKNLEELQCETFFISFAPMPIKGLDSCPVRVYAIEGLEGF